MRTLNAKIDGKIIASWQVPESAEEITYRQMIMFSSAYEIFLEVKEPTLRDYLPVMSAFFDMDVEAVRNLPMNLFNDFEKSMTGLFVYIFQLIAGYRPKIRKAENGDHLFKYLNKSWRIPHAVHVEDIDLTFGQGIDLLDIQRKAKIESTNRPNDIDSLTYTTGLNTLAVLVSADGEELPEDDIRLRDLIQKRVKLFADIDMVTALDCIFFLTRGKSASLRTGLSPGFSTRQALTTVLSKKPTLLRSVGRRAS